jgi:hypothetical protein
MLESWFSLMSTLEEALKQVWKSLEVMGVFEEVSKVVPLWHSFKHGPHGEDSLKKLYKNPMELWLSG